MSDHHQVVDRLKKLILHEQSARKIGSVKEAEAFAGKIQQMLFDFKLNISQIDLDQYEEKEPVGRQSVELDGIQRKGNIKKRQELLWRLAQAVAKAHYCNILIVPGSAQVFFVGRPADRAVAIEMYHYLVNAEIRFASNDLKAHNRLGGGASRWAYLKSHYSGFAHTIAIRYSEQRHKQEMKKTSANQTQALVVIDRTRTAVQHFMTMHGAPSRQRHSQISSDEAYGAGVVRGKQTDLGSKRRLQ